MPRGRVWHTVSVQLCQTLASQVWCKLATCTWACSVSPDGWTGGWRHTQAQSIIPNPLPWFSSCQRRAASVSLAAFHLFRCQWAGNSHSCTLLDIAGWQPLGLLLHDWWVKSGSCLQQHRGIWDTSPALGCKHIHLSAVVTRMIKRGKVERDKMSVESQLDEKGKKDQKGAWLMDLHAGQGIHTLRIPLTYPCPLPILRHIEVGLDWFMPRAHWHWASSDKEAYTDVLPCHHSFLDFLNRGLDRDGKQTGKLWAYVSIPATLVCSSLYPWSDYGLRWTVKTATASNEVKTLQSLKAASHSHLGLVLSLSQTWQ